MALSSNVLFARDEVTADGASPVVTGVSTLRYLMVYTRRFDDDGPALGLTYQHRWASTEPWVTFYTAALDAETVAIDSIALPLADEIRVAYDVHGQGTGGVDFQILLDGRA